MSGTPATLRLLAQLIIQDAYCRFKSVLSPALSFDRERSVRATFRGPALRRGTLRNLLPDSRSNHERRRGGDADVPKLVGVRRSDDNGQQDGCKGCAQYLSLIHI